MRSTTPHTDIVNHTPRLTTLLSIKTYPDGYHGPGKSVFNTWDGSQHRVAADTQACTVVGGWG